MREHGHGIGQAHVCPIGSMKLMEPFVSTIFDGMQRRHPPRPVFLRRRQRAQRHGRPRPPTSARLTARVALARTASRRRDPRPVPSAKCRSPRRCVHLRRQRRRLLQVHCERRGLYQRDRDAPGLSVRRFGGTGVLRALGLVLLGQPINSLSRRSCDQRLADGQRS